MTQQEFQTRYKYNPSADYIGEGGFGKVYKAYDTHLDRWVAIKVAEVKPGLEQVRLKKEVEMVSKLPTHPNIANYEACYTFSSFTGEYDFAVLQYYEEGNLQQLIDSGKLNQTQKETLLRQILEGVGFLHNQEIIHRDLKPQNILIAKRYDEYIPKITDFGISKKLDINKSSVFTNSLAGAGTMAYASPEQLLGKTIKKNTDLWSFGVIAFQLFTDKLPFNTGNESITSESGRLELFKQITSGKITSLLDIPSKWQNLILKCLVVDVTNRCSDSTDCLNLIYGNVSNVFDIQQKTTLTNETTIVENSDFQTKIVTNVEKRIKKNNSINGWIILSIILIIAVLVLLFKNNTFTNQPTKSNELKFKDGLNIILNKDSVIDIDGNIYHTITIGDQIWMLENLKTTKFRNGDQIETTNKGYLSLSGSITESNDDDIAGSIDDKLIFQWIYNNNANNLFYGRLYTWDVVIDERGIAPNGWRVANSTDWYKLLNYLITNECISKADSRNGYYATNLITTKPKDCIKYTDKGDSVSIASCFSVKFGGKFNFGMKFPGMNWWGFDNPKISYWWLSDDNLKYISIDKSGYLQFNQDQSKSSAYTIRCIKE